MNLCVGMLAACASACASAWSSPLLCNVPRREQTPCVGVKEETLNHAIQGYSSGFCCRSFRVELSSSADPGRRRITPEPKHHVRDYRSPLCFVSHCLNENNFNHPWTKPVCEPLPEPLPRPVGNLPHPHPEHEAGRRRGPGGDRQGNSRVRGGRYRRAVHGGCHAVHPREDGPDRHRGKPVSFKVTS